MKAILIPVGILLASVSVTASAESPTAPGEARYQPPMQVRSSLTRAEINAEAR